MQDGTQAVVDNLRAIRPQASERELRCLALLTYRSYARDTIDFIRSLEMDRARFAPMMASFDAAALDDLLAQGRGVLLVGGHFGNWELGGVALRLLHGYALTVIGKAEASPIVGAFRRRMRDSFGIETLEIGQMLETALRIRGLLSANRIVAMLLDRHIGRDCVEVTFFGRSTPFLRTPAMIGYLSGAPLLPAFMIRRRRPFMRRRRRSRVSSSITSVSGRISGISFIRIGGRDYYGRGATSASVTLPVATSTPSARTSPSILINIPMRRTTRARASSCWFGRAALGNLNGPSAASRSIGVARRSSLAAARPPVCASSSISTIAGTTGSPGKWP